MFEKWACAWAGAVCVFAMLLSVVNPCRADATQMTQMTQMQLLDNNAQVTYEPLIGAARSAVQLDIVTDDDEAKVWRHPLKLDLLNAQELGIALASDNALEAEITLHGSQGAYQRAFRIEPGEQIVLLPLGSFHRVGDSVNWRDVTEIELAIKTPGAPGPPGADTTLHLLSLYARSPEEPLPGDMLYLHRPATRVTDFGVAFPLYAIVAQEESVEGKPPSRTLAKYLDRMFSIQLPVHTSADIGHPQNNVIRLGADAATEVGVDLDSAQVGYQGFIIEATDSNVIIAGANQWSTEFGVYRFLEEQGCRFYSRHSEIVPTPQHRRLAMCALSDRPVYDVKRVVAPASLGGWSYRFFGDPRIAAEAHDEAGWFDKSLWLDHTASYLVPEHLYYDEHPEYYSSPKGTPANRLMLCLSNPDVLAISTRRMLRWIEQQPDRAYFMVAQGDGIDWCDCSSCQALGNRADQTLHWINHVARVVAEKYPDKVLVTNAYNTAELPPLNLKPEPSVVVLYAAWPNASNAPNSFRDFDARENVVARHYLEGWLKVAPQNMGLYDYNAGGRYTLYGMADRLKWGADHDLRAVWYCGTPNSFADLFVFVHSKLGWDPSQDPGRLKNEFIRAYYGDAAPTVIELFDLIHDRLEFGDYGQDSISGGYPSARFFNRAFVERVYALFDEAINDPGMTRWAKADLERTRQDFVKNSLRVHPGPTGNLSDDQYAVFGKTLREYAHFSLPREHQDQVRRAERAKKTPPTFSYQPLVDLIWELSRVRIELGDDPTVLPTLATDIMEDPRGVVEEHRQTDFVTRTATGWNVSPLQLTGGQYIAHYAWECPPRSDVVVARGQMTEFSKLEASFNLGESVADAAHLLIEGQDSDKLWSEPVPLRVRLNDQVLFEDTNPFPKRGWGMLKVSLPAGVLQPTDNVLTIENLAASDSLISSWVMISQITIESDTLKTSRASMP